MQKKYLREVEKMCRDAGYTLKRKKRHYVYRNEKLGRSLTIPGSPMNAEHALRLLRKDIRRNELISQPVRRRCARRGMYQPLRKVA